MANKDKSDWRPGPEIERSHAYEIAFCDDPNCGLHILPKRGNGTPICEVVMSAAQTRAIVEICQSVLYEKATDRDE